MPGISAAAGQFEDALRAVAVNSSYNASRALSRWFRRAVRLKTDGFQRVPIAEAASVAGDPETAVAAVHMVLRGQIAGDVLLAVPEAVGLMLADTLMGRPVGSAASFSEIERSALQETANIVGTSFANSLARWLNVEIIPQAPLFAHDMACAIVQPLILEQAAVADEAWISDTEFEFDRQKLDWRLLLLLTQESVELLSRQVHCDEVRQHAMHAVAVNAAFEASRAMSRWLDREVRFETEGFRRVRLGAALPVERRDRPIVSLQASLTGELGGRIILTLPLDPASRLVRMLLPGADSDPSAGWFDPLWCSCLQETANFLAMAFTNSLARWMDLATTPSPPDIRIDTAGALFQSCLFELKQAHDELLVADAQLRVRGEVFECSFYWIPTTESFRKVESFCN